MFRADVTGDVAVEIKPGFTFATTLQIHDAVAIVLQHRVALVASERRETLCKVAIDLEL